MGCGQVVRRLTLDQEIEGSNPSIPANFCKTNSLVIILLLLSPSIKGSRDSTEQLPRWPTL